MSIGSILILFGCSASPGTLGGIGLDAGVSGQDHDASGQDHEAGAETAGDRPRQPVGILADASAEPTDAGDEESDATCGSVDVNAEVKVTETVLEIPGNVLFVFDQSGSMDEDWDGTPKWQVANESVVAVFTPLQDTLSAGAVFFPTFTDQPACDLVSGDLVACLALLASLCPNVAPMGSAPQVPIQAGASFLTAWNAHWTAGRQDSMGTPTEKALLEAEAALATPLPGATAVVIVTDGQPTCGSNETAIVARLLENDIKTYVVGLPGGAGATVLDSIAIAGGTAPAGCTSDCYLTPTDVTELQESLAGIVETTVTTETVTTVDSCSFTLSPPGNADPENVHLIVTLASSGEKFEVPRAPDNGWTLSDDNLAATLEGATCEAAKQGDFSSFSFQYGCVEVRQLII
jgi:hypothetical protein